VSLSTVSGLVDRLVDQGLVSRHHDPADRRQVVVAATPAGVALVDRFRQLGVGELQELLMDLSDEELGDVRRAFEALDRAIARAAAGR
jgi:DNA-binding MarR family transcriptional regulator